MDGQKIEFMRRDNNNSLADCTCNCMSQSAVPLLATTHHLEVGLDSDSRSSIVTSIFSFCIEPALLHRYKLCMGIVMASSVCLQSILCAR